MTTTQKDINIVIDRDSNKSVDLIIDVTGGVPGAGLPVGMEDYFKSLIVSVLSNLDEGDLEPGDFLVAVKNDGSLAKVSFTGLGSQNGVLSLSESSLAVTVSVGEVGLLNLSPEDVDIVVGVSATAGFLNVSPDNIDIVVGVSDTAALLNVSPDQQSVTVSVSDSVGQLNLVEADITAVVTVSQDVLPTVPEGRLSTYGNQIIDSFGNAVRLKTVNWFGGEGHNYLPHGLWTGARRYTDIIDDIADMGFNCIRFPFSGAWSNTDLTPPTTSWNATLNPEFSGLTSLEILDLILAHCATHNIYVVLDHHRSHAGSGADGSPMQSGYGLTEWHQTWKMMATRYKDNLTVIGADVHNEPHNLSWTTWKSWVEGCAKAIHDIAPDWLIFAEGIGAPQGEYGWWGGYLKDVRTQPIVLDTPNKLVYSPHEYAHSVGSQPWLQTDGGSVTGWPLNLYAVWRDMWGYIYEDNIAPIWIGEFGGHFGVDGSGIVGNKPHGSYESQWVMELVKYLNGDLNGDGTSDIPANKHGISFSYWSYNPNSGDTGGLVQDDWTARQTVKVNLINPLLT